MTPNHAFKPTAGEATRFTGTSGAGVGLTRALGAPQLIAMARESLEKLGALFNLGRKREVERYCRDLVITSEDFADVVLAARIAGFGPYTYTCHFREIAPESLEPSQEEINALGRSGVGALSGNALKAARKMDQLFRDRRLLATHLFYSRLYKYWHMFYFDQRDYQPSGNHWDHGPHLHYSQYSFTRESLQAIWQRVCAVKPELPPSVHVRYDYHHNRVRKKGT